jgi:hypothetical protein
MLGSMRAPRQLSLAECRRLIGEDSITDEKLEQVRDGFYAVARTVTCAYLRGKDREGLSIILSALSEDDRAEVEERAAIIEFEGKLSRDQAERLALNQYRIKPPRV